MGVAYKTRMVLCGPSALGVMRLRAASGLPAPMPLQSSSLEGCCSNPARLGRFDPAWVASVSRPLHVLVSDAVLRSTIRDVDCHVLGCRLPRGSICHYNGDVDITSPALTFVQLAARLSLGELVLLGDELCGSYSMAPTAPGGFVSRPPLCRIAGIAELMDHLPQAKGLDHARRALPYLVEWSASPRESVVAAMLSMSVRAGGFGLEQPLMNPIITSEGRIIPRVDIVTPAGTMSGDLVWAGIRAALEYDSSGYHEGEDCIGRDSARRARLLALGIEPITITNRQVKDLAEFAVVADVIASRLGTRKRGPGEGALKRRVDLHRELLAFSRMYGVERGLA